jgi:hypothetical protein
MSSPSSANPSLPKILSFGAIITVLIILFAFSNSATPLNTGINEYLDNSNIIMLSDIYWFCIWCFFTFVLVIITLNLLNNNFVFG